MKNNPFKTAIQWLVSLFCWLTLSPVFYFLVKRWNLIGKKPRVFLLLISPLFLIIYGILIFWGTMAYFDFQRKHRFADEEVLERITGVQFPDFRIVEYNKGGSSFTGDYSDELLIEFKDSLSAEFYETLDSIAAKDSLWSISNNVYSYGIFWGNGLPAPEGESDDEDMTFNIVLEKGSKQANISYGSW